MQKIVLLNPDGKIVEVLEENMSSEQFAMMMDDYCRLIQLEAQFNSQLSISKSNEEKLHILFQMLVDKGAFKNHKFALYPLLKPYIDDAINEHEYRKKLNAKLVNFLTEKRNIFYATIKKFAWKAFIWISKIVGKRLIK